MCGLEGPRRLTGDRQAGAEFRRGRRRGTGSLGVGATMASALDGCAEGMHPGRTKDVSWLSPQVGPGLLGHNGGDRFGGSLGGIGFVCSIPLSPHITSFSMWPC